MRFSSVAVAISVIVQVLGYPTSIAKRVVISGVGDIAGSEVISGGKAIAGTELDTLTTAQKKGPEAAKKAVSDSVGSTGIISVSSGGVRTTSVGGDRGINVVSQIDGAKNITNAGPTNPTNLTNLTSTGGGPAEAVAMAKALGNQIDSALATGRTPEPGSTTGNRLTNTPGIGDVTVSQGLSVQNVTIDGQPGVLIGGNTAAGAGALKDILASLKSVPS